MMKAERRKRGQHMPPPAPPLPRDARASEAGPSLLAAAVVQQAIDDAGRARYWEDVRLSITCGTLSSW